MAEIDEVLNFWFEESGRDDWFAKDPAFDEAIRQRFAALYRESAQGGRADWADTAAGCVARCIVLDQFPRNMFRDDPRAFATDPLARATAHHAVERKFDRAPGIDEDRRLFLYLPFAHHEDMDDQRLNLRLVQEGLENPKVLDSAERHLAIIERFGRFPHRNAALGRETTAEEAQFLTEDGSSF